MKILVINQFFWPDLAPTSVLLTDLVRHLVAEGHEVTALCSRQHYAATAQDAPPNADIIRLPGVAFRRGAGLGKLLSYLLFFVGATFYALRLPKQDAVLLMTTPPLLCVLGPVIKYLRGSNIYLWEMDLYPDIAVALGVLRPDSLLTRTLAAVTRWSRRAADGIIALGPCMRDRLVASGLSASRIYLAENWADGTQVRPIARTDFNGVLTVLYSGNLGLAHDIDTVISAAQALAGDARIAFHFAGNGPRRQELAARCDRACLPNVAFLPFRPADELAEALGACDIGLVTQRNEALGTLVPSKLYGLLAAGRPVLFIGPEDSTVRRVIARHQCGWHVECGNAAGLASLLRHLAAHPELVRLAGRRARQAFLAEYDRPAGVRRIADILTAPPLPAQQQLPARLGRRQQQAQVVTPPC